MPQPAHTLQVGAGLQGRVANLQGSEWPRPFHLFEACFVCWVCGAELCKPHAVVPGASFSQLGSPTCDVPHPVAVQIMIVTDGQMAV